MDHIQKTIDELNADIAKREAENTHDKQTVNRLLAKIGKPEQYPDAGSDPLVVAGSKKRAVARGQFAGEPAAASAARAYLSFIGKDSGGATLDEIYEALKQGNFGFTASSEKGQKDGLRIAMGKDYRKIVFLGNDTWGLAEWWPNRPRKRAGKGGGDDEDMGADESPGEGDEASSDEAEPEKSKG